MTLVCSSQHDVSATWKLSEKMDPAGVNLTCTANYPMQYSLRPESRAWWQKDWEDPVLLYCDSSECINDESSVVHYSQWEWHLNWKSSILGAPTSELFMEKAPLAQNLWIFSSLKKWNIILEKIAILSCHSPEVKHMHPPMSEKLFICHVECSCISVQVA